MSLLNTTVKNVGYVGAAHLVTLAVRTVTLAILSRLLLPEDFGVVAIALFILNALNQITDLGVMAAMVHRQHISSRALATGTTMRIGVGVILYGLIALSAPYWTGHFGGSSTLYAVWAMSAIVLIVGLGFPPQVRLTVKLRFKKLALANAVQNVVYATVATGVAYAGLGYWSIVLGELASWCTWALILWSIERVKVELGFDTGLAKDYLRYGVHVLGSSLIIFAITNLDNVIVGYFLGVSLLGYYVVAYKWGTIATTQVTSVINRVIFPTFSRINSRGGDLSGAYLGTLRVVSFIVFPLSLGMMVMAEEFITIFLTEKWLPATHPLLLLSIFGLLRALAGLSGSVFKAVGRPQTLFRISTVSLLLKVTAILWAIFTGMGIVGVAFAVSATSIFVSQLNIYYAAVYSSATLEKVIKVLTPPAIASGAMAIAVIAMKWFNPVTGISSFLLYTFAGACVYIAVIYLMDGTLINDGLNLLRNALPGSGT